MHMRSRKLRTIRVAYLLSALFSVAAAVVALLLAVFLHDEFGWILFVLFAVAAICSVIVAVSTYSRHREGPRVGRTRQI